MRTNEQFVRFGNPSQFALEFRFIPDPDGDEKAPAASVGSWGQWRLWIDGLNLTEHDLVLASGEIQRQTAVTWYLAPLFRWLVQQWGPLLHEERLPAIVNSGQGRPILTARDVYLSMFETRGHNLDAFEPWQTWASRHSLRCAAEGGLVPDVFIRRLGDDIEVSWGERWHPGGEAAEFRLETGVAHSPVEAVGEVLNASLQWFIRKPRLAQREWRKELVAARVAQRLKGQSWLSWYFDGAAEPGRLTELYQRRIGKTVLSNEYHSKGGGGRYMSRLTPEAALFGALSPEVSDTAATRLLAVVHESRIGPRVKPAVEALVTERPAWRARSPSDEGYEMASDFLEGLEYRMPAGGVDLDVVLKALDVKNRAEELGAVGPRGVALAGEELCPTIVVNLGHRRNWAYPGRRFTIAHELCHILFDRDRARRVAHASTPWAPVAVEQRANAFAAMMLMPPELIRRALPRISGDIRLSGIADAARVMQVSLRALIHHLANIDEISEDTRDRLLDELELAGGRPALRSGTLVESRPTEEPDRGAALRALIERVQKQPIVDVGRWTREELYER